MNNDSTDTRASSPLSSVHSSPGPEPKPQLDVAPPSAPVVEASAIAPAPPPAPVEPAEPTEPAQPIASTSSFLALASPSSSLPALRKSSRTTRAKGIDYANLDQHLPASVDRWISTISAREASGGIVDGFTEGGFRKFGDGRELGAREVEEWIYGIGEGPNGGLGKRGEGMTEPFVVERPEGLGMEMPPPSTTVKDVAELVGALPSSLCVLPAPNSPSFARRPFDSPRSHRLRLPILAL